MYRQLYDFIVLSSPRDSDRGEPPESMEVKS